MARVVWFLEGVDSEAGSHADTLGIVCVGHHRWIDGRHPGEAFLGGHVGIRRLAGEQLERGQYLEIVFSRLIGLVIVCSRLELTLVDLRVGDLAKSVDFVLRQVSAIAAFLGHPSTVSPSLSGWRRRWGSTSSSSKSALPSALLPTLATMFDSSPCCGICVGSGSRLSSRSGICSSTGEFFMACPSCGCLHHDPRRIAEPFATCRLNML